jgi:hypothetical protein
MLENVNRNHVDELAKYRLSLNHLWLLEKLYKGWECDDEIELRGLQRKGLAHKMGITEEGRLLYELITTSGDVSEVKEKVKKKREKVEDEFSLLWAQFPRTSTHETKGVFFQGTRVLRKNEEKCRLIYNKSIAGNYPIEDILRALEYEVWSKKNGSNKNENKLEYMQTLETWLNQKTFESYWGMEIPPEPKVIKKEFEI